MSADDEPGDIDQCLEALKDSHADLRERCLHRSALRVAQETARLAKNNERLIPYLEAQFNVMNQAQSLFEPELGKNVAIELIALLEDDGRARRLQPDFPEEGYYQTVGWMSACAYDNLAEHTAKMEGYNSEGMQSCISEGIEVCRRTGKLRCVTCFREYATEVHLAADDVDMALHFSRLVQALPKDAPNSERRWVGAKKETWAHLLLGQLDAAEVAGQRALELAPSYHTPLHARLDALVKLDVINLLAGKSDVGSEAALPSRELPDKEFVALDMELDLRDALRACCRGEFERAKTILETWDRWLTQKKCLSDWFEIRLRLIALHRLQGLDDNMDALLQPLVERARQARDWLTLHRLGRLLDPSERPDPLALLGPLKVGPFAAGPVQETVPEAPPLQEDAATAAAEAGPPHTPMQEFIGSLFQRLQEAGEDAAKIEGLCAEVLALEPARLTDPNDAAWLLFFLLSVTGPGSRLEQVWNWTEAVAAPFPPHPAILNLHAAFGELIRDLADSPLKDRISVEDIERRYRQSLDLDPFNPRAHARAGDFFLRQETWARLNAAWLVVSAWPATTPSLPRSSPRSTTARTGRATPWPFSTCVCVKAAPLRKSPGRPPSRLALYSSTNRC